MSKEDINSYRPVQNRHRESLAVMESFFETITAGLLYFCGVKFKNGVQSRE